MQQEAGLLGDARALVTPTYDLSCPFGVRNGACPFGTVHNVNKRPIAARIAAQIYDGWLQTPLGDLAKETVQGPAVKLVSVRPGTGKTSVRVTFSGGLAPLHLAGTQNCAACCGGAVGDFDASADGGATWINGSVPTVAVVTEMKNRTFNVGRSGEAEGAAGSMTVEFTVDTPAAGAELTHVRYTANQPFPQCAVYNADGRPALPFSVKLTKAK